MKSIIVAILIGLIQAFSMIIVFKEITDEKASLKKYLTAYFIVFIYMTIASFIPSQFRILGFMLITTIIIYSVFNFNVIESLIASITSLLIISISEVFITVIFSLIGINLNLLSKSILFGLVINISNSLLSITLSFVFKKLLRKIYNFFVKNKKLIIHLFMIVIFVYLTIVKNAMFSGFQLESIINFVIFIIFFIFLFLVAINEEKNESLKRINEQTTKHIIKYEKIITDQGKKTHEFKNQLMVIKGYAKSNSPKLMEYLDTVIDDTNKLESTYLISQLNKFPDGGIKGLLYYKLCEMEDAKIKYSIYCEESAKKKINKLNVTQMNDVTKVLGVMLDNAIDATKKAKKKEINISLCSMKGNSCITVENTYSGKINKDKIGTGYTTKGKGHGFGLQLTKDIIKNNKYLKYEFSIVDKMVVSKLFISLTTKK